MSHGKTITTYLMDGTLHGHELPVVDRNMEIIESVSPNQ